uniref:Uncharacterized protein n=1 Tax=Knipowitschia caucasica TaxID=637954 RepID=A0AAV2LU55_KNICA
MAGSLTHTAFPDMRLLPKEEPLKKKQVCPLRGEAAEQRTASQSPSSPELLEDFLLREMAVLFSNGRGPV